MRKRVTLILCLVLIPLFMLHGVEYYETFETMTAGTPFLSNGSAENPDIAIYNFTGLVATTYDAGNVFVSTSGAFEGSKCLVAGSTNDNYFALAFGSVDGSAPFASAGTGETNILFIDYTFTFIENSVDYGTRDRRVHIAPASTFGDGCSLGISGYTGNRLGAVYNAWGNHLKYVAEYYSANETFDTIDLHLTNTTIRMQWAIVLSATPGEFAHLYIAVVTNVALENNSVVIARDNTYDASDGNYITSDTCAGLTFSMYKAGTGGDDATYVIDNVYAGASGIFGVNNENNKDRNAYYATNTLSDMAIRLYAASPLSNDFDMWLESTTNSASVYRPTTKGIDARRALCGTNFTNGSGAGPGPGTYALKVSNDGFPLVLTYAEPFYLIETSNAMTLDIVNTATFNLSFVGVTNVIVYDGDGVTILTQRTLPTNGTASLLYSYQDFDTAYTNYVVFHDIMGNATTNETNFTTNPLFFSISNAFAVRNLDLITCTSVVSNVTNVQLLDASYALIDMKTNSTAYFPVTHVLSNTGLVSNTTYTQYVRFIPTNGAPYTNGPYVYTTFSGAVGITMYTQAITTNACTIGWNYVSVTNVDVRFTNASVTNYAPASDGSVLFTFTNLTANETYALTFTAVDIFGNTLASNYSFTTYAPPVETVYASMYPQNGFIRLSFSETYASYFVVTREGDDGTNSTLITNTGATMTFDDTEIVNGASYTYTVYTVNAASMTNEVRVRNGNSIPLGVTNFRLTQRDESAVPLSSTRVADVSSETAIDLLDGVSLSGATYVTIVISDMTGRRKERISRTVFEGSATAGLWNFRDNNGAVVPMGTYVITVILADANRTPLAGYPKQNVVVVVK